jgi:hypothetical protein
VVESSQQNHDIRWCVIKDCSLTVLLNYLWDE